MQVDDKTDMVGQSFDEVLMKRALDDFDRAKRFLDPYHRKCKEMDQAYRNHEDPVNLRARNKFPWPTLQEDINAFVADTRDKLFYADRPCSVIGRSDTDQADAEQKQEMLDYQDQEDRIFEKVGIFLRDVALKRMCAAQVVYEERTERQMVEVAVPMPQVDQTTGQIVTDETGAPLPAIDQMGQVIPSGETTYQWVDVPVYKGAAVKRIDQTNLFFTVDKERDCDEWPIMVRSWESREFFNEEHFYNQEKLDTDYGDSPGRDSDYNSRMMLGEEVDMKDSKKGIEYVEWQGKVSKKELYEHLGIEVPVFDENEKTWVILGIADRKCPVRLEESFTIEPGGQRVIEGPNIRIGVMMNEDEGLIGMGLGDLIKPFHDAMQDLSGILLEQFKQSISPFTIINRTKLAKPKQLIHGAGNVLEVNSDPKEAIDYYNPPDTSGAIYNLMATFKQTRQNAGGIQDAIAGTGDEDAETLGEFNQVVAQASLRMRDYLRTFEKSFILPLYKLRNQINAAYLDEEYLYGVLDDGVVEWKTIEPAKIRASVDFICEASTRETNRNVLIQQFLHFLKIAPSVQSMGLPVRLDKLAAELAEVGFSWKQDKIEEIFPALRLEREGVMDIDAMVMQNSLLMMAMGQAQQTGQMPEPRTETEAVQSANAAQQPPTPGRMN